VPFFNSIVIYGLSRHNFTKYTLINPVITAYNHDTYAYSEGSGIMQNTMTVDYETVLYDYGSIDGTNPDNTVTNFGLEESYDRRLSPIAFPGSNKSILGQGGLLDGVGGTIQALSQGNILGAVVAAGTTYNTFKGANLKQVAKQEVLNGVTGALANPALTRNVIALIPTGRATPNTVGTAGAPVADDLAITTRPSRIAASSDGLAITTRPTRLISETAGYQVTTVNSGQNLNNVA
jgi:hypothetical protein